jgi:hypothetical protein
MEVWNLPSCVADMCQSRILKLAGSYLGCLGVQDATLADVQRNEYLGSAVYPNGGLMMKVVARCAV